SGAACGRWCQSRRPVPSPSAGPPTTTAPIPTPFRCGPWSPVPARRPTGGQTETMTSPQPSLSWPTSPTPPRIAELRSVVHRLTPLAHAPDREPAVIPGLAAPDAGGAADPPPALEQVTDELGGLSVRGRRALDLLVEERTDVGPSTQLGEPTSYYPLHEDVDVAVVLTVAEDGTPGAVYGIGEDLALHLAAPDLGAYLTRFADALEQALSELDEHIRRSWGQPSVEDETAR